MIRTAARSAAARTLIARTLIARALAVRLSLALVALLISVGSAQNVSIEALVGSWQTSIPNPGGPTIEVLFHVLPDGRYREEGYWQGQLAGFWEGALQVAPDGTLTMRESNVSPQICFGQCMANDAPTTVTARLVGMTQSSITLVYQDPEYGPSDPVVWQRAAGAPQATQAPGGQVQAVQPPTAQQPPATQQPPVAPGNPWAGTFSDGDLTLVLFAPDGDYIERGGVRYPVQLQGDTNRLEGTFHSGSDAFPVTLERTPTGIVLSTGGARFDLRPIGAMASGNPLGN